MVTIDEEIELLKLCRNDSEKYYLRHLIDLYPATSKNTIMELMIERYEICLFNR